MTQITWEHLPQPLTQFRFHKVRRWRCDFAWPDQGVLLEVEGATWVNGRHTRGAGYEADIEKYNAATLAGWKLYRVTTGMVTDGRAIEIVKKALGIVEVE